MTRKPSPNVLFELVQAILQYVASEDAPWQASFSRLDGKTARLVLSDDSIIDLHFRQEDITISNVESQSIPEITIEMGQDTLELIVRGQLTPVEAVFSALLTATGPADDLIVLYNTFLEFVSFHSKD